MALHQRQRCIHCGVRAGATRILLVTRARRDDIKGRAPPGKDAACVIVTRSIEYVEETLRMFERVGIGGKTFARKQRSHQAAARAVAYMQRFGHGAEVSLDAGGERSA